MFECWWQNEGFEAWRLRGDLRGASRRWQHRLNDELWLWINVSGEGVVWGRDHRIFLKPGLFGCFGGQDGEDWKWTRLPGHHEAEILIIPRDHLIRRFGEAAAVGNTPFARWLRGEHGVSFAGLTGVEEERLARLLAAGWHSRTLPASVDQAVGQWVKRILGAPQDPRLLTSVKVRKRRRSAVKSRKAEAYQGP